ncbi:type II toxin-antitoxin system RelE/ParE family toxin [Haloferula sp. BvORR071]|uniref:type II toxin-antitoxin system RelE/ParE family toxin n=1 Tax=Haloferula sp. BvORR071 TaxID=1396141 RepID=UPI0005589D26|nr:type II toxin-antitoxin system RelE/ParE family toxin [Haloferula sp. BvORR071]
MRLRVLESAEADVAKAFDYYEDQSRGLGFKMTRELGEALHRILDHPTANPPFDSSHRRRNLKKFPYGIFYRLHNDEVVFAAFFHNRSDPARWDKLLKKRG